MDREMSEQLDSACKLKQPDSSATNESALSMPEIDLADPALLQSTIQSKKEGEQRSFVRLNSELPVPDHPLVYRDYEERATLLDLYAASKDLPVVTYEFKGLPNVLVEDEYDGALTEIRELRLKAAAGDKASADKLKQDPLANALLPEQIAKLIDALPQTEHIKEVTLDRDAEPNILKRAEGTPPMEAVADTNLASGVIRFFADARPISERMLDVQHEYFHLLETEPGYEVFKKAIKFEGDEWSLRDYAKFSEHENFAVHGGEAFLGSTEDFKLLTEKLPGVSISIAATLDGVLKKQIGTSPMDTAIRARIDYVIENTLKDFSNSLRDAYENKDYARVRDQLKFLTSLSAEGGKPEWTRDILSCSGLENEMNKSKGKKLSKVKQVRDDFAEAVSSTASVSPGSALEADRAGK